MLNSDLITQYMFSVLAGWPCIDRLAQRFGRVEDVFCIVLPEFIPHLKNPCFYEYSDKRDKTLRCLPYFYIIGMDKSGTTDLNSRITQHPSVVGNRGYNGKETNYWSWYRYGVHNKQSGRQNQSLDVYLDNFVDLSNLILGDKSKFNLITGDATPMDLWDFRSWQMIPQNFGQEEPDVLTPHLLKYIHRDRPPKLLVQFREPIDRLYSDYVYHKYGRTPEEFHNHSLQAVKMMNDCLNNHTRRQCFFSDKIYQDLPVRLHLGCYVVFLREWLSVFPRSCFMITTIDEYQKDMKNMLTKLFTFLDLSPLTEIKMSEILAQSRRLVTEDKKGAVLPETVQVLRRFYDGYNKEAAKLLADPHFLWKGHYQ
ncbi:hypothetical protein BsWGS_03932 [Bradybaena similaris]